MTSSDLIPLSDNVYALLGGVNAAIVVNPENEALLVDTGGDKEYGRRLKRACGDLGVTPVAILNTHSHADHYGGNDFLVRNFDLPVYAPPFEASIMTSPYLEPVYLFNGAKPPPELQSKWLLAKPSKPDETIEFGEMEPFGISLETIDTSGHAHTHVSVKVGDVLLAADAVFGESALSKYPLPFGQDVGRQMESARKVTGVGVRVVLPGHGEATEEVDALVAQNLAAFERAADAVADACMGVDTATVLSASCEGLGITMNDLPRYYLNLCTVQAYLSFLRETGRVRLELQGNTLRWERVG